MAQEPDAIRAEIAATRQRMGDAVEALAYKTDVKARARDKVAEVREIVTTATESFVASVREPLDGEMTEEGARMSTTTSSSSSSASSEGWEQEGGILKRNPLAVAFGAAAIGFLAGLLIPSTPAENERLGPVADHVKQSARDAAQEAVGRGKAIAADAAASAAAAAKETAENAVSDTGSESGSSGGSSSGSGSSGGSSTGRSGSGSGGASSSGSSSSGSSSSGSGSSGTTGPSGTGPTGGSGARSNG